MTRRSSAQCSTSRFRRSQRPPGRCSSTSTSPNGTSARPHCKHRVSISIRASRRSTSRRNSPARSLTGKRRSQSPGERWPASRAFRSDDWPRSARFSCATPPIRARSSRAGAPGPLPLFVRACVDDLRAVYVEGRMHEYPNESADETQRWLLAATAFGALLRRLRETMDAADDPLMKAAAFRHRALASQPCHSL